MAQQTQLSEARLLDLLLHVADNLDDGIIAFDVRCRFIFWNRAMERITGLLAGEIVGRNVFEAFPALLQNSRENPLQKALSGQTLNSSQVPFPVPTEKTDCFEAMYYPFKEWGKVAGAVAIVRDLTLLRRAQAAEAALEISDLRFRRLFEQSPLSMMTLAPNGYVLAINQAHEKLFGTTLEQLADYNIFQDPQLAEQGLLADVQAVFQGETREWPELACHITRDAQPDQPLWTRSFIYPVMEGGNVREVVWCRHDISPQKQAQAAHAESEARLRRAHRTGNVGAYELDLQSRTVRWFVEVPALHGRAQDGLLDSWLSCLLMEDRSKVEDALRQLMTGEGKSIEVCVHRPDGKEIWLRCGGELVRNAAANATHVVGAIVDITEAKAAEGVLRESEERFRFLANSLPQIVWVSGARGEPEFYNEQWFAYAGLRSDAAGVWNRIDYEHPADRKRSAAALQQALQLGERYDLEVRLRRGHDQSYRWHLVRSIPMRDDSGQITRWFGTATDIHDLKTTQDELRLSRQQLRLAQESARAGMWQLDLDARELTYSTRFAELTGLPVGGVVAYDDFVSSMPFAADQERARNAFQQVSRARRDFSIEFRIGQSENDSRRIAMRGQVVQLQSRHILAGLAMDLTESRMEQATPAIMPEKTKKASKKSDEQKKPSDKELRAATG